VIFFISLLRTDFAVVVHHVELHIMLQDVSTLKSPNVIVVFLKLNDLFVKNNNVVMNKRLQSSYYCVHNSINVLFCIRELEFS
jgi:hypothetical protein